MHYQYFPCLLHAVPYTREKQRKNYVCFRDVLERAGIRNDENRVSPAPKELNVLPDGFHKSLVLRHSVRKEGSINLGCQRGRHRLTDKGTITGRAPLVLNVMSLRVGRRR